MSVGGGVTDEDGNVVLKVLVTPEQQAEMEKKADEFMKNVTLNRFLDETTTKLFFF